MKATDMHLRRREFWALPLLFAALVHCDGQASTNPAGAIETLSSASAPQASVTAPIASAVSDIQALVDAVLKASPIKEILSSVQATGPCATQEAALETLVSTFIKQVETSGKAPDQSTLDTFVKQVQTDVQSVVACACTSSAKSAACP